MPEARSAQVTAPSPLSPLPLCPSLYAFFSSSLENTTDLSESFKLKSSFPFVSFPRLISGPSEIRNLLLFLIIVSHLHKGRLSISSHCRLTPAQLYLRVAFASQSRIAMTNAWFIAGYVTLSLIAFCIVFGIFAHWGKVKDLYNRLKKATSIWFLVVLKHSHARKLSGKLRLSHRYVSRSESGTFPFRINGVKLWQVILLNLLKAVTDSTFTLGRQVLELDDIRNALRRVEESDQDQDQDQDQQRSGWPGLWSKYTISLLSKTPLLIRRRLKYLLNSTKPHSEELGEPTAEESSESKSKDDDKSDYSEEEYDMAFTGLVLNIRGFSTDNFLPTLFFSCLAYSNATERQTKDWSDQI